VTSLEERVTALETAVAALTAPEPGFTADVKTEVLDTTTDGTVALMIRLTHQPTGVMVVARDRAEGIAKLRHALANRTRRQQDLQQKTTTP